jgi:two-component system response regulator HydG
MSRIVILMPADDRRAQLAEWLEADGHVALGAESVAGAIEEFGSLGNADVIIGDESMGTRMLADAQGTPVFMLSTQATVTNAVKVIKAGASHYQAYPATADELLIPVREALAESGGVVGSDFSLGGNSPGMRALLEHISKVAPTESTVLISGESGTGKELVARALHASSQRRLAALISVNCAAIPTHLIEAELFGHDQQDSQRGLLEAAEGGTLFLDEIGELPLEVQGRLLQVLAGSTANVRLIAATQRDLAGLIESQQFRQDLYYRLKVVSLDIPPLRERGEDILQLAEDILTRTSRRLGKLRPGFCDEAKESLVSYHWPGNVRELENAIERAVILGEDAITTSLLAIEAAAPAIDNVTAQAPEQTMEDYFVSFVTAHQDQLTETELAERLGISRKSLWERRQRLNIPRKKTRKRGPRRDVS